MADPFETTYGEPTTFEAVLAIQAEPGSKRFLGVSLIRDDGSLLVVDYRADPKWRPFEGKRVVAEGRPYWPGPATQHIVADHFEVRSLTTVEVLDASGTLEIAPMGPPGSKLADEVAAWLQTDEERLLVVGDLEALRAFDGSRVEVKGRRKMLGLYVTHTGAPLFELERIWRAG